MRERCDTDEWPMCFLRQIEDQELVVRRMKAHDEYLESQLKDNSAALLHNDMLLLQSARELGTYRPEDLLVCLYRNPNNSVQMLLEAVAVMFGMEPNWLSTRRMCFEGALARTCRSALAGGCLGSHAFICSYKSFGSAPLPCR